MNTIKKPTILCVIPARLKSTRLPNKPLVDICGKPLVEWVYTNAEKSSLFDKIIVATDSLDVQKAMAHTSATVEMTPENLQTGTDRIAFVAQHHPEFDVVVNVQGDEPFVPLQMLEALLKPYLNGKKPPMATVAVPFKNENEMSNPNTVKTILKKNGEAIYFSRNPIPHFRNLISQDIVFAHVGLYAYTRDFLLAFSQLEQTPLEIAESLEQLRAIEHGFSIHVELTTGEMMEVNTPGDLEAARDFCRKHILQKN